MDGGANKSGGDGIGKLLGAQSLQFWSAKRIVRRRPVGTGDGAHLIRKSSSTRYVTSPPSKAFAGFAAPLIERLSAFRERALGRATK
jgi:hypothetical protein